MTANRFRFDLGDVDLSAIETDAGLRREAKRLVPKMLERMNAALAKEISGTVTKALRGGSLQVSGPMASPQQLAKEMTRNASVSEKRQIEDALVTQLTDLRTKHRKPK
jgi:hypothetical protein